MKLRRILYRLVGAVVSVLRAWLDPQILLQYRHDLCRNSDPDLRSSDLDGGNAGRLHTRADGVVKMISFGDTIRKIEDFYEAFKNVPTPLGSGYLGRFYTMKQPGADLRTG